MIRLKKEREGRYTTSNKEWTATKSSSRIKGLRPSYYVSDTRGNSFYVSTLKEAEESINSIEGKIFANNTKLNQ